jgi:rod shape-determining protein MreC
MRNLRIVPTIQRPLILLAIVLGSQLILLGMQIKREGNVPLISVWAAWAVTPFQKAGNWMIDSVSGAWNSYVALRSVRKENAALHEELNRLKIRAQQLEGQAAEVKRLTTLLAFKEANAAAAMLTARVVGGSPSDSVRAIYIDRGESDGVRRNMAVITPDGAVGKILAVYGSTAQVLLITDKESGVGALLEKTRTMGVVRGTGDPLAEMNHVINEQEVGVGETILTSGLDQIFPKDIPVGVVASTEKGNPFKVIRVRPAARLDRLEEVIVLLAPSPVVIGKEAETRSAAPAATPSTPN